jgi:hypothetical protein
MSAPRERIRSRPEAFQRRRFGFHGATLEFSSIAWARGGRRSARTGSRSGW